MHTQLLPTTKGLTLGGVLLAKRAPDGSCNLTARGEERLEALLTAAWERPVPAKALGYIKRAMQLFAEVPDDDLAHANFARPERTHTENNAPLIAKMTMLLALSGFRAGDPKAKLEKAIEFIDGKGVHPRIILKAFGKYSPDQPRDDHGRWTDEGGEGGVSGSANDDQNDSSSTAQASTIVPVKQTKGADNPAYIGNTNPKDVVLGDGTVLTDFNGNHIQMPGDVSLRDNIAFGESIKNMRSIDDPSSYFPLDDADLANPDFQTSKEDAMVSQFDRSNSMDYQRIYSTPDGKPNPMYVDFGNYNFGAVAAAAGYSLSEALEAAAIINAPNITDSNANIIRVPFTGGPNNPWLSNPTNDTFIAQGYNDYKTGKIKSSK